MKKLFPILLVVIFTVLYLFSYRASYLHPYDHRYSRDLFDNSQWRIPESNRGIGDELLYQVASYELVNTWGYFEINPEVPPLGKYLYGISLSLTQNAFWINLPIFMFASWVVYQLACEIFKKYWQRNLALLLFLTQPVIFSQLNTTMFDLPQMLALLIHGLAISKLLNSSKRLMLFTILAGLSAGAFVSLKIGYLILFIFIVDAFFLLRQKKWQNLLVIFLLTALIYPLTYLPYFLQGNSLIAFIKSQLWILHFYADSKVPVDRLLMPISFFTGWYRGWSENAGWTHSEHWSLTWPMFILIIVFSWVTRKNQSKSNSSLSYLTVLFILIMFAYWLIPFWIRYLVLTIPLLILITVSRLDKAMAIGTILLVVSLIQLPFSLISRPQPIAQHLTNLWRKGSYLDLYSYLEFASPRPERFEFAKKIEKYEKKKQIQEREVNFVLGQYNILSTKIPVTMQIKYQIPDKQISFNTKSSLVRVQNQWRLMWLPKFGPTK